MAVPYWLRLMHLLRGSPRLFQTGFLAHIKHSKSSAYIMRRSTRLAAREVGVEPEENGKQSTRRANKKTTGTIVTAGSIPNT